MNSVLPIILYILGSILLVVLIILGIKLIIVMDKIERTVDNINTKVDSLNGFFSIVNFTTDKLAMIGDKVVEFISEFINKVFIKNKEESEENE